MRRIQIHLDDDMDDRLATEARRRGMSKAALIRERLRHVANADEADPIDALIGAGGGEPAPDINVVIYDKG